MITKSEQGRDFATKPIRQQINEIGFRLGVAYTERAQAEPRPKKHVGLLGLDVFVATPRK